MGSMDSGALNRLVDRHFEQEVAGNIDGILSTFTDDIRRRSSGEVVAVGKDAARTAYRALFSDMRITKVTTTQRWTAEGALFDHSMFDAIAVGAPFGYEGRQRPFQFGMLHVFEFRDDLISREDGWTDVLTIRAQLTRDTG